MRSDREVEQLHLARGTQRAIARQASEQHGVGRLEQHEEEARSEADDRADGERVQDEVATEIQPERLEPARQLVG